MKKTEIGQTINTLANIGVVLGIVFLAVEVRQNQSSLEEANTINLVNARDATQRSFREFSSSLAQDGELMRIFISGNAGDELSPIDQARYRRLCTDMTWSYATAYERFTALGMRESAEVVARDFVSAVTDRPGQRECWETLKDQVAAFGTSDFVPTVERAVR